MITSKRAWQLVAIPVCLSILAGCGKSGSDTASSTPGTTGSATPAATSGVVVHKAGDPNSLKLAFVTNNASEYWKIAQGGVHKYEKDANVQVDFKIPPNGKTEEQNVILENLVSQGYDGIAVSVCAPNDQVSNINAAAEKTNVICADSDCPKSNRIEYVGTENYTAGQECGNDIVKLLPKGGDIAVFVGTFSADNAAQRLQGIADAIKGHNINIIAKKEDATDKAKARSNVEDVMNANPNLALVCGLWSYNGPAIASAIDASGKKGKVLAAVFDQEQGTLDGVKAGTITCTVVQDPFGFAYEACKQLHDLAIQGPAFKVPSDHKVPYPVKTVDGSNIDQYNKDLAAQKAM